MLRSKFVKSYNLNSLDDIMVDLQDEGCTITEVRSVEINENYHNLSIKCNGFLILYNDPYADEEEETEEPNNEDLTNAEKFEQDWGRRPIHANVVGSVAYEYLCPTNFGIPVDQKAYNIETGLCSASEKACSECAKRFWQSKYKKPGIIRQNI